MKAILSILILVSSVFAEPNELGRPPLSESPYIIHATPKEEGPRNQIRATPKERQSVPRIDSSFESWMEGNGIATIAMEKEPYSVYVTELGRWARPQEAILIFREIDRMRGYPAHAAKIAEIQMSCVDCSKLQGLSKAICHGLNQAFSKKGCIGLEKEALNFCSAFKHYFIDGGKCPDLNRGRAECIGIKVAAHGDASQLTCSELHDDAAIRACTGAKRALEGKGCSGLERTTFEYLNGSSQIRFAYCEALSTGRFAEYVATHKIKE
jgi:LSD1 subclass zinc finger protein